MLIKQQKRENCSWLNHFCNFIKKKYTFNLHTVEYAVLLLSSGVILNNL